MFSSHPHFWIMAGVGAIFALLVAPPAIKWWKAYKAKKAQLAQEKK